LSGRSTFVYPTPEEEEEEESWDWSLDRRESQARDLLFCFMTWKSTEGWRMKDEITPLIKGWDIHNPKKLIFSAKESAGMYL
jgi:hypothetical protein